MIYELAKVKDATKVENNEELARIAAALGLEVQARRYSKRSVEDCFTSLTDDEWKVWRVYCPTPYWLKADPKHNRLLKDYGFDTIPGPVLRHWKMLSDEFAFDNFIIRTTEKTPHIDPLLLGTLGQSIYLLARWGEEAPGLLTLKEVATRMLKQHVQSAWNNCSVMFESNRPHKAADYLRTRVNYGNADEVRPALRILGLSDSIRAEEIKVLIAAA